MKKIATSMFLLFALAGAMKAEDGFTVSSVNLELGSSAETCFTVSLDGGTVYTAYNMDIYLPDGIEVTMTEGDYDVYMNYDDDVYPYTGKGNSKTYKHSFGVEFHADATGRYIRIACTSNSNAEFKQTSGALFDVWVRATNYCKPGTAQLSFSGLNLTENNGESTPIKHVPADFVSEAITVGNTCSIAVNVSAANQFGTCILPFSVTDMPSGLKAYSAASAADGYVNLTEASTIEAYKPYILYAETGYSGVLSGTVDESQYVTSATEGVLTGVIVAQNVSSGYILQNKGDGAQFYKVGDTPFALPAGKCYMSLPDNATAYNFRIGTTNITAPCAVEGGEAAYDLQGRPAAGLQRGFRIVNGKKILVR